MGLRTLRCVGSLLGNQEPLGEERSRGCMAGTVSPLDTL